MPSSPMTLYPHTYKKLQLRPAGRLRAGHAAGGVHASRSPPARACRPRSRPWPTTSRGPRPTRAGQLRHPGGGLGAALRRHDARARGRRADMKSVPYRGGAPLLQDLMGGQVPVSFNVISEVLPHVRSGKLRSLAVTSAQRWPSLPEVPTLRRAGLQGHRAAWSGWAGMRRPRRRPSWCSKLNAAVREALQAPEMQEVARQEPACSALRQSPEDFAAHRQGRPGALGRRSSRPPASRRKTDARGHMLD